MGGWISIHDTIDGPKLRPLCRQLRCCKAEAEGILSSLWMWARNNADKHGLILNADEYDISMLMIDVIDNRRGDSEEAESIANAIVTGGFVDPRRKNEVVDSVLHAIKKFKPTPEKVVEALIECGFIDREAGRLYIHDWSVWQKEWYAYQERKERDNARKRKSAQEAPEDESDDIPEPAEDQDNSDRRSVQTNEAPEKSPEQGYDQPEKPEQKKCETEEYSEDFKKFWVVYPKKDAKVGSYRCFRARQKDGYSVDDMIAAAKAYAMLCKKERREKKHILLAQTFLGRDKRFIDYIPKVEQKPVAASGDPYAEYALEILEDNQ